MLSALRRKLQARRGAPRGPITLDQQLWLWFIYGLFLLLMLLSFRFESQLFIYKTGFHPFRAGDWIGIAYDVGFVASWEAFWLLLALWSAKRAPQLWMNAFVGVHFLLQLLEIASEQFLRVSHQRIGARFALYLISGLLDGNGRVAQSAIDYVFWSRVGVYVGLVLIVERLAKMSKPPTLPSPRRLLMACGGVAVLFLCLPLSPNAKDAPPGVNLLASFSKSLLPTDIDTKGLTPAPLTYEFPKVLAGHGPNAPNILLVVLESTSADVIWPRDGSPSPMPFLRGLSDKGIAFKHAMTGVTHTSAALITLHCGMFPELKPKQGDHKVPFTCLPRLLGDAGYRTGFWQAADGKFEGRTHLVTALGYQNQAMPESLATPETLRTGYFGFDERVMVEPMVSWMKADPSKPFLATALTVSTHHPYQTPGKPQPAVGMHRSDYAQAATYVDGVLRSLVTRMETEGLLDNTLLVFMGDHGEAFDEHIGYGSHDGVPYDEVTNIPIVFYAPRLLGAPREDRVLRHHVDLLPTLMNLTGIRWTGTTLGNDMLKPEGHDAVYSFCYWEDSCIVQHRGNEATLFHYSLKPPEFFDTSTDPLQINDISSSLTKEQLRQRVSEIRSFKLAIDQFHEHPPSPPPTTSGIAEIKH